MRDRFVFSRLGLGALVVVYVVLAGAYIFANPIFEAPDENWHYVYVRHLAEGRGLPREVTTGPQAQNEAAQPPLYYAVAALLTFWAPRGELAQITVNNPVGSLGNARSDGNKNRFLHTPDQLFPWRGEVLTVHFVRLTTTLWGVAAVVFTYFIGRTVFPSPNLGLAAAGIVAFTPEFLFMSAAVNNDVPVAATTALLVWLCVLQGRRDLTVSWSAALGVAAGLVILTKPIAAGCVVLVPVALAYAGWRNRASTRRILAHVVLALVAVVLTSGWWFALNLLTYGSPIPLQTFLGRSNLFNEGPSFHDLVFGLPGLRLSYWAVFGWFSIVAPPNYYHFFDALTVLGLTGWIVLAIRLVSSRSARRDGTNWSGFAPVAGSVLLVFAAVVAYRIVVFAFHGRLLFGAAGGIAVLLASGWSRLAPVRAGPLLALGLALTLSVPAALALPEVLVPAYASPLPRDPAEVHPRLPIDARIGDAIQFLGVDVSPSLNSRLSPGDQVDVTLYLQGLRPIAGNYMLFLQLVDVNQRYVAGVDSHPGHGASPTSAWEPGKVVVDRYTVRVPTGAAGPRILHLIVGMYDYQTQQRLATTVRPNGPNGNAVTIGTLILRGPNDPSRVTSGVAYGGKLALVDYHLDAPTARPGDDLNGYLLVGGIAPMARDYTVFVQLIGPKGLVAQDDSQPVHGAYPTSVWQPGDLVRHDFRLAIPSTLPAGDYSVITGWYDLQTGQRLTTSTQDAVPIGTVHVE